MCQFSMKWCSAANIKPTPIERTVLCTDIVKETYVALLILAINTNSKWITMHQQLYMLFSSFVGSSQWTFSKTLFPVFIILVTVLLVLQWCYTMVRTMLQYGKSDVSSTYKMVRAMLHGECDVTKWWVVSLDESEVTRWEWSYKVSVMLQSECDVTRWWVMLQGGECCYKVSVMLQGEWCYNVSVMLQRWVWCCKVRVMLQVGEWCDKVSDVTKWWVMLQGESDFKKWVWCYKVSVMLQSDEWCYKVRVMLQGECDVTRWVWCYKVIVTLQGECDVTRWVWCYKVSVTLQGECDITRWWVMLQGECCYKMVRVMLQCSLLKWTH